MRTLKDKPAYSAMMKKAWPTSTKEKPIAKLKRKPYKRRRKLREDSRKGKRRQNAKKRTASSWRRKKKA